MPFEQGLALRGGDLEMATIILRPADLEALQIDGDTIDFFLRAKRNQATAHPFFGMSRGPTQSCPTLNGNGHSMPTASPLRTAAG